jgi:hypothetical protein
VYAFNIGMPEDVVDHMFDMVVKSASVKYVIMFAFLNSLPMQGQHVNVAGILTARPTTNGSSPLAKLYIRSRC